MKTSCITLFLLFLSAATLHAQTVRVVNNNPSAPSGANVYTSVPAAIAASNSGDILHFIPSPVSYGSFTIDKSLKIYGVGFNPDKDSRQVSQVQAITITSGTTNVVVEGLHISGISIGSASNITIRKNRIIGGVGALSNVNQLQNILFQGNIVSASIVFPTVDAFGINGFVISNNIFTNTVNITGKDGMVITHNLFLGSESPAFNTLVDVVVTNNLFVGAHARGNDVRNTVFQNNLVFGNTSNDFPIGSGFTNTGSGNLIGVDPKFTGFDVSDIPLIWKFEWDLTLLSDSPAKTAGTGGSEIGIFGGATPFDRSGVPLPLVQTLTIPHVIGSGQAMDAMIRARSITNN